ncbi:hypothetical protein FT643_22585 [Ketobacter sp. MCCC 1A13808]|uniref:hypothetical protein n=1 Tax=Ketobacter sp. MCCC 1A13808 TaxID=2602738 RepID=UPI0012EB5BD9|nr:hypothetical protein [Ketobacter sp. MCCC 1A13808]MVF14925.1 hypothetical protein [Ketobacter sp. MCCC 1A13808]
MIRTNRKSKLPKGFAYPLGAEKISEALNGIPQAGSAVLTFEWRDEFWASKWRERVASLGVVTLIHASYWDRWDEWRLFVYAVPREYNAAAREHLLGHGLEELAANLREAYGKASSFSHKIKFSLGSANAS